MAKIPQNLKFVLVFGIIGFFLSFITGLISGIQFGTIVIRAIIFMLVFASVGFGFFQLFNWKFQEILEESSQDSKEFSNGESLDAVPADTAINDDDEEIAHEEKPPEIPTEHQAYNLDSGAKKTSGHFGDHIMVQGIKIENEPKLMASAIRTLMAKDDK